MILDIYNKCIVHIYIYICTVIRLYTSDHKNVCMLYNICVCASILHDIPAPERNRNRYTEANPQAQTHKHKTNQQINKHAS